MHNSFILIEMYANRDKLLKLRVKMFQRTLKEMSEKSKVNMAVINGIERGTNKNPSVETMIKVCRGYDITIFEFLEPAIAEELLIFFLHRLYDNKVIDMKTSISIYDNFKSRK